MKPSEPLGIHGVVIRSADLRSASRWKKLLGLPVLRRNSRTIVLGRGPEFFVRIVRAGPGEPEGVAELHVAVEKLSRRRKGGSADPLGGDVRIFRLGKVDLILREFRRPPGKSWRPRQIGRPGGAAGE